ncbi:MAG: SusC/RagA family TonB-linked outer membrane protein, partial [Salinimicrobium sp.]
MKRSKKDGNVISRIKKSVLAVAFATLCCSALPAKAYGQTNNFSLHLEGVGLDTIIEEIERSSEYVFIFPEDILKKVERQESINVSNVTIDVLLEELFKDLGLQYRLLDKQIVVFEGNTVSVRHDFSERSQEKHPVKGVVRNNNGEPIIGATVLVKGTRKGTITDFDGNFSFEDVSEEAVLIFSFLGYENKEVPVNGRNTLEVILQENIEALEEVVVTSSYGTAQKKENLVSSVYEVKSETIKNMPAQRVDQLLEGLVPGLVFNPQSDDASSSRPRYSVTIRGEASMSASNEPLWIIDGTPLYTGDRTNMISGMQTSVSPLSYLNPEDIESITVLKDASATSLYGADGANGVILITTKRGKAGKMRLTATAQVGVTQINRNTRFNVLSGDEYRILARESYENAGLPMNLFPFTDNPMNNYSEISVNWYDIFYDRGSNAQVNLSASGGSEEAKYYVSGSYYTNKATLTGNDQERFTLRSNNTLNLNERLSMQLSLGGSYNTNSLFTPGHEYYENLPILSPYNEDGSYRLYYRIIEGMGPDGEPKWIDRRYFNALAEREQNDNEQRTFSLQGSYRLIYELLNGLTY